MAIRRRKLTDPLEALRKRQAGLSKCQKLRALEAEKRQLGDHIAQVTQTGKYATELEGPGGQPVSNRRRLVNPRKLAELGLMIGHVGRVEVDSALVNNQRPDPDDVLLPPPPTIVTNQQGYSQAEVDMIPPCFRRPQP